MRDPHKVAETPPLVRSRLRFGMRPGLDRIRRLLRALGDPHLAYPVVHVAGTNGKGSTAAMIASVLAASGYKVGMYTSPHLVAYGERIVVDGLPITAAEMAAVVAEVEPALRGLEGTAGPAPAGGPPRDGFTEFEVGTALAFCALRRSQVDVAVVEVGLGGRLDATNVVSPLLTVITAIDLDHTQVLGDTLAQVAGEKAGILKPGVPLVLAPQQPEAEAVVRRRAEEVGAPVRDAVPGHCGPFTALQGQPLRLPLLGSHQQVNAAVAITAAGVLAEAGWDIDAGTVARGLANVRWPGRIEVVQDNPLVILDGAHNLASTEALASTLAELGWNRCAVLVFGTLTGKPADAMLRRLMPYCKDVVLTQVEGRLPAQDAAEAGARWSGVWPGEVVVEPDVEAAFARAEQMAGPRGTVLVSGSLYLVGALRHRWPFPALFRREPRWGQRDAAALVAGPVADGAIGATGGVD